MGQIFRERALQYIFEVYSGEAAYIFRNAPEIGVCRHGAAGKWYAVFMPVEYKKFGLQKEGAADVVTLKCLPHIGSAIADGIKIFPAYHM